MTKLRAADADLASELDLIREKTKDFENVTPTFEKNFNELFTIVKEDHPSMIAEKKAPEKKTAPQKTETPLSVIAPVLGTNTGKIIDMSKDSRKDLLKEVEDCEKFLKENRAKVRELRGERIKKPVRRSPSDRYATGVQSLFKGLAKEVKDENKVEQLKAATHAYIAKIRSIMGFSVKTLEKQIETIASQAEKRIEKAA